MKRKIVNQNEYLKYGDLSTSIEQAKQSALQEVCFFIWNLLCVVVDFVCHFFSTSTSMLSNFVNLCSSIQRGWMMMIYPRNTERSSNKIWTIFNYYWTNCGYFIAKVCINTAISCRNHPVNRMSIQLNSKKFIRKQRWKQLKRFDEQRYNFIQEYFCEFHKKNGKIVNSFRKTRIPAAFLSYQFSVV